MSTSPRRQFIAQVHDLDRPALFRILSAVYADAYTHLGRISCDRVRDVITNSTIPLWLPFDENHPDCGCDTCVAADLDRAIHTIYETLIEYEVITPAPLLIDYERRHYDLTPTGRFKVFGEVPGTPLAAEHTWARHLVYAAAEEAGWGIAVGPEFHPFPLPGYPDHAARFVEDHIDEVVDIILPNPGPL